VSMAKRLPLTEAASPLSATPAYLFYGSKKCPYPFQKFDSDPERRFAAIIDSDRMPIVKWLRPGSGQFDIEYGRGRLYEPDFVLECADCKLIVEVKAARDMEDPIVTEKMRAAKAWVQNANAFADEGDGKPWHYILIADTHITESLTFSGLLSKIET
jgi:type III restriction enzyme